MFLNRKFLDFLTELSLHFSYLILNFIRIDSSKLFFYIYIYLVVYIKELSPKSADIWFDACANECFMNVFLVYVSNYVRKFRFKYFKFFTSESSLLLIWKRGISMVVDKQEISRLFWSAFKIDWSDLNDRFEKKYRKMR